MKGKRIGGIILLVIGILLLGLGFYVKSLVSNTERPIVEVESPVPFCPAHKVVEVTSQDKIDYYTKVYKWSFGGGILLSIVGIGMIAMSKKR